MRFRERLGELEVLAPMKAAAYGVLDLITRPVGLPRTINGRKLRLAARCWRAFPSLWEAELHRFLDEDVLPGMIVADVGAHVGIHTLGLAHRVGRDGHVFAFEPVPHIAEVLRRHVKLNGFSRTVTVVESAVGAAEGVGGMFIDPKGLDPGNSFVNRHYADRLERASVLVSTLDDFFAKTRARPALVKIDVEGYELKALRGATHLLQHPDGITVACAVHPWHLEQLGDSEDALFEEVRALGFKALDLNGRPTGPSGTYREIILRRHARTSRYSRRALQHT